MVRPAGRQLARMADTLEDLREEFLAHCEARNLSGRTLEWYADRTRRFADWCSAQGISAPSDLRWSDLEEFVLDRRRKGFAPNTVHGYAQVLKTLCRLGHRMGYIPEDITANFEMPRVPRTIVPTPPTSSFRPSWWPQTGGAGWASGTEPSSSSSWTP